MPTISAKVSKKELDAIQEYANACGETMSNLIRKVMIYQATFLNWSHDSHEYDYEISIPENVHGELDGEITLRTYNQVRKILGLPEMNEI
jgi:hypothetical protein